MASAAVAGRHGLRHLQRGQPGRRSRGARRRLRRRGVADRGRGPRDGAGHLGRTGCCTSPTTRAASRPTTPPTAPACGRYEVAFPAAGGIAVVDGTVYAGWGWWLAGAPDDAEGGLIAFRPGGAAAPTARRRRRRGRATVVWPAPETPRPTTAPAGATCTRSAAPPATAATARARAGPPWPASPTGCRSTTTSPWSATAEGRCRLGRHPADEEIEAVVDYERDVLSGDAGG